MLSSETFNILYKKIKDGIITKSTEEYEKIIDNLGKMSGLTREETLECIQRLNSHKISVNRFCNPYFKKSNSSNETIEENIYNQSSLNHSFSLVNVGLAEVCSR